MGSGRGKFPGALLLAAAVSAVVCVASAAAPGGLDRTFGGDGKVTTNPTPHKDSLSSVALQPNGRILVGGETSPGDRDKFTLARYREDGRLDRSFGGDGLVKTKFKLLSSIADVALQADGKIVAVGRSEEINNTFALARYNRDGTLDSSFNRDGKATTSFFPLDNASASGVVIQPDDQIVVAGTAWCEESFSKPGSCGAEEESEEIALARYDPDRTLDTSFGEGGKVTTDIGDIDNFASAVALQADGKIVVAGGVGEHLSTLVRYNQDGTLDPTFGEGGIVTAGLGSPVPEYASDLAIQADGKIVTAGRSGGISGGFGLARYNPDGTPDTGFSGDGRVRTDFTPRTLDIASAVAIQASGKIVAAGRSDGSFALARYNPNGTPDTTFSGNGKVRTNFTAYVDAIGGMVIQPNDRILAVGVAGLRLHSDREDPRFALARYGGH
jgi:uncharacterized delta-60 repeat protein